MLDVPQDPALHRALQTLCKRAKRTLSSVTQASIEPDGTNMDYFRVSKCLVERCYIGFDELNAHDVVHLSGFTRTPVAHKMI